MLKANSEQPEISYKSAQTLCMASSWKVIKGPFISAVVPQEPLVIIVVKSHEKKRFHVERLFCFVEGFCFCFCFQADQLRVLF